MSGSTVLRGLAFLAVSAALIGFGFYAGLVSGYNRLDPETRADAIVILTGDYGRLSAGGELLRAGHAPEILITGVHPSVTVADIRDLTGLSDAEYACCVTLDRAAPDTDGNARETAQWARSNGYTRLIIVTSDYHLPRSLVEMEIAMPGVELIAYPVRTLPPWRDPGATRLWLQEYAKYVAVKSGQLVNASDAGA